MLKITIDNSEVALVALEGGRYHCPCPYHEQMTLYKTESQLLQHIEQSKT